MGSFANLTATMQNVAVYEYDQSAKVFILGLLFIFSVIYLWVWRRNQEPTSFFSIRWFRVFGTILSWIYLVTFPLHVIYLAPQVDFWDFFTTYFVLIYSLFGAFFVFLVSIDVILGGWRLFQYFTGLGKPIEKVDPQQKIFNKEVKKWIKKP